MSLMVHALISYAFIRLIPMISIFTFLSLTKAQPPTNDADIDCLDMAATKTPIFTSGLSTVNTTYPLLSNDATKAKDECLARVADDYCGTLPDDVAVYLHHTDVSDHWHCV
eukprot:GHVH01007216.1.p1 GENE.GHVH01007216.1~~GHVH01007216.1.p1  ORF type:complete len:111 (+),score=11.67 GHVH01007216.1:451-783(+)